VNAAVLHILGQPPRYVQFREPIPTGEELLVHVRAAALKPVDRQMASGAHYASPRELPIVCGIDGVGRLEDGSRVFFAAPRRPFGAMAERTVVDGARCWPVPEGLSDIVAAALVNLECPRGSRWPGARSSLVEKRFWSSARQEQPADLLCKFRNCSAQAE
jgi:NADPH:quinone reductase-like Zn-dependent oxidoreductase